LQTLFLKSLETKIFNKRYEFYDEIIYGLTHISKQLWPCKIEYSQVFRVFWGNRAFFLTQSAFFLCITCLLIASIVDTAQVLDQIFAQRPQGVSALRIVEGSVDIVNWSSNDCLQNEIDIGECIPFFNEKEGSLIFSLGYIVAAIPFIPMSVMDLKVFNTYITVHCIYLESFMHCSALGKLNFSNSWIRRIVSCEFTICSNVSYRWY
jgi:hypothetical protein